MMKSDLRNTLKEIVSTVLFPSIARISISFIPGSRGTEKHFIENITVYNVRGQKTNVLVDQVMPAGDHSVEWAATDAHNQKVASGMYFYRITTDSFSESKKMILLK